MHRRYLLPAMMICLGLPSLLWGQAPPASSRPAVPQPAGRLDAAALCGRLEVVGDLSLLYLWGPPEQRGLAHGYLLAESIRDTLLEYLNDVPFSGGPGRYERTTAAATKLLTFSIDPRYLAEMRGMLRGIHERLGDAAFIAPLGRAINLDDLKANATLCDASAFGCSSFAAWGELTETGQTLAARNLDWHARPVVTSRHLLIVNAPDPEADVPGWVSLAWPGSTGCYTAVNADGLMLAMHDVPGRAARPLLPFTPRSLLLREALEHGVGDDMLAEVTAVFARRRVAVGTNLAAFMPSGRGHPAATIFECEPKTATRPGVTPRAALKGQNWQACTNHFRLRDAAVGTTSAPACDDAASGMCGRYDALVEGIRRIESQGAKVTVDAARGLLAQVARDPHDAKALLTLQSVIFDMAAGTLHVAVCNGSTPATQRPFHSFVVAELLRRAAPAQQ